MKGRYGRNRPHYGKDFPDVCVLESQILNIDDFTDNTNTTGYIDVTTKLPAGAVPIAWKANVLEGFAASTISVGVSGDTDRFSADTTQSIATTGEVGSTVIAADACKGIGAAVTVRVTVTEDSDFGDLVAGSMKLFVYYIKTK